MPLLDASNGTEQAAFFEFQIIEYPIDWLGIAVKPSGKQPTAGELLQNGYFINLGANLSGLSLKNVPIRAKEDFQIEKDEFPIERLKTIDELEMLRRQKEAFILGIMCMSTPVAFDRGVQWRNSILFFVNRVQYGSEICLQTNPATLTLELLNEVLFTSDEISFELCRTSLKCCRPWYKSKTKNYELSYVIEGELAQKQSGWVISKDGVRLFRNNFGPIRDRAWKLHAAEMQHSVDKKQWTEANSMNLWWEWSVPLNGWELYEEGSSGSGGSSATLRVPGATPYVSLGWGSTPVCPAAIAQVGGAVKLMSVGEGSRHPNENKNNKSGSGDGGGASAVEDLPVVTPELVVGDQCALRDAHLAAARKAGAVGTVVLREGSARGRVGRRRRRVAVLRRRPSSIGERSWRWKRRRRRRPKRGGVQATWVGVGAV